MAAASGAPNGEEQGLPRAAVAKLVTAALPKELRLAADARDVLVDAATEFVQLVGTEANEISEEESKKTIEDKHVVAALERLGFAASVAEAKAAAEAFKADEKARATRLGKRGRAKQSAEDDAAAAAEQERLFAAARARCYADAAPQAPP